MAHGLQFIQWATVAHVQSRKKQLKPFSNTMCATINAKAKLVSTFSSKGSSCKMHSISIIQGRGSSNYSAAHRLRNPALDGSMLLKFLLETRLKSKYFDTLDDLLGFWVQKF